MWEVGPSKTNKRFLFCGKWQAKFTVSSGKGYFTILVCHKPFSLSPMENAQFFCPQWICNGEEKTPKDLAIKITMVGIFCLKRQQGNRRRNTPLSIHDNLSKSHLQMDYSEGHPSLIKLTLWTVWNLFMEKYQFSQCQLSVGRGPRVTTRPGKHHMGYIKEIC